MIGRYCVIRCKDAGVHCGVVRAISGRSVLAEETRRIHYWTGAFTLSKVAQIGAGPDSRISTEIRENLLLEACEVIPCEPSAELNLRTYQEHGKDSAHSKPSARETK
jgi:hypothetical protein